MEAVRTSETSVDNHFTRQYNPEDNSEHHTRRRENLKSHIGTKRSSNFENLYKNVIHNSKDKEEIIDNVLRITYFPRQLHIQYKYFWHDIS
jgi:hypothetical protein